MKIISWNICGIGTRNEKGLLDKLLDEDPDILCLQEIKKQEIPEKEEIVPAEEHSADELSDNIAEETSVKLNIPKNSIYGLIDSGSFSIASISSCKSSLNIIGASFSVILNEVKTLLYCVKRETSISHDGNLSLISSTTLDTLSLYTNL